MSDKKIVLSVENLFKKYHEKDDYAVEDINFSCYSEEIVGIIGQNGAGKSTIIKCITGIHPITEGTVKICDYDIKDDMLKAKQNIGYASDDHAVFEKMTGLEYLNFLADVYGVDTDTRKARMDQFQTYLNLGLAIERQISSYSHGMHQKISIMGALIHQPELLVLDEPLTGLDPQTVFAVKEFLLLHKKNGKTVLFSSHNLNIVEQICDRYIVINHGKLIEEKTLVQFKKENPNQTLEEYFLNLVIEDNKKRMIDSKQDGETK